jgi:hypothetical protein
MYDVHMFIGIARAGGSNPSSYPVGEKHTVRVFARQPTNTEPDWELAASYAERAGWTGVELQVAMKVDRGGIEADPATREAYDRALAQGGAIIVFP